MGITTIGIGIVRADDCYLVGTRESGSALSGYAEFPGGKLEPDETIEECVQRECLEETGLQVTVGRLLLNKQHDYKHGSVDLHFYSCDVVGDHPEPSGLFRWVPAGELGQLTFPEANAEVLALL